MSVPFYIFHLNSQPIFCHPELHPHLPCLLIVLALLACHCCCRRRRRRRRIVHLYVHQVLRYLHMHVLQIHPLFFTFFMTAKLMYLCVCVNLWPSLFVFNTHLPALVSRAPYSALTTAALSLSGQHQREQAPEMAASLSSSTLRVSAAAAAAADMSLLLLRVQELISLFALPPLPTSSSQLLYRRLPTVLLAPTAASQTGRDAWCELLWKRWWHRRWTVRPETIKHR